MSIKTNFKSVQDIKVIIGTESAVGSGILHSSATWRQLSMIAPPTINENQVALDMGSQQTGTYTPNKNQMKQRVDNPMWEIQLQFLANSASWAWGGVYSLLHNTGPSSLASNFTPPDWTNGATNTYGEHPTSTIYIGGCWLGSVGSDLFFKGCVCTGISLSHSIDSNGGFPVITANFLTGYQHTTSNLVTNGTLDDTATTNDGGTDGDGWTDLSSDAPVHWTELDALVGKHVGETAGDSSYDVRAFSYNLNISRNIERVGYTTSSYDPMSYEQVGGFTVTGDVTFKKDNNFGSIDAYFNDDAVGGFKFANPSGYEVFLNGKVSDVSNDTGSPELRNTISFQGAGDPSTSDVIVSIDL